MIFENTEPLHQNPQSVSRLPPSAREQWLQKVIGFWIDATIVVEQQERHLQDEDEEYEQQQMYNQETIAEGDSPTKPVSPDDEASKDSLCLWVRTQSSVVQAEESRKIKDMKYGSPNAASVGAVVGLHWDYDPTESRFCFEVVP
ncbi:hypothetical protein BGZ54_009926 [Gamsiella multidivaricata]|nr:hypothetical protein BGZ54_009926 [Gamsiella multidivaricata]